MYALISLWQLPQAGLDQPVAEVERYLGPFVRQWPGFIESYWTYERTSGKSFGFTLVDTAEHAHDLSYAIECHMEERADSAVRLEMIRVVEMVGSPSVPDPPPLLDELGWCGVQA